MNITITSPPGSSVWGNSLAESITGLIKTHGDVSNKNILEIGGGTLFSAKTLVENYGAASVTIVDPALPDGSVDKRIKIRKEYFDAETCFDRNLT